MNSCDVIENGFHASSLTVANCLIALRTVHVMGRIALLKKYFFFRFVSPSCKKLVQNYILDLCDFFLLMDVNMLIYYTIRFYKKRIYATLYEKASEFFFNETLLIFLLFRSFFFRSFFLSFSIILTFLFLSLPFIACAEYVNL